MATYEVTAEVWRYPGAGGFHFLTLPAELAAELADELAVCYAGAHRPFGTLRVDASLGSTTWNTSLFKDTRSASYLLPIKAQVRRAEGIDDGDTVTIQLQLDE